jgi:phycobilisome rod-core linker protein
VVDLSLKRLLGRASYGQPEQIAWSIKIATLGLEGFVDALIETEEYQTNFGDNTVPYQRRRFKDRPFNLVNPRYATYWRDKLENDRYKWGDVRNFLEMAQSIKTTPVQPVRVQLSGISIPDMTRDRKPGSVPVSVSTTAGFPLR